MNQPGIILRGHQLFGKVEGVVALLKGQAGVGLQVLQGDGAPPGQGMLLPQVDKGAAVDQRVKDQPLLVQQLQQGLPVALVQIQDADFAAEAGHVLDHLPGAGFPDGQLVFRHVHVGRGFHKGLDGEGIMLGGNGEAGFPLFHFAEFLHQRQILGFHLPGVGQEAHAVRRQGDALAGAAQQDQPQLLLQLLDGAGQGGLGYEKLLGGLSQGAGFGDGDHIADLLQGHGG